MPLRWFSGLLISFGISAVLGFFLVVVGVRWVMLSFLVLVTVFMGHGGCVVCLVSFFPTFVQEVVVFVSFFGFFPFVVIVGVVRMGGVVLICAGRGCR